MDFVAIGGLTISAFLAAGCAAGAWRTMGRIEGKVERYKDRLNRHSDKIDEHDAALIRINGLPRQIQRLEDKVDELVSQIRGLS